MDNVEIVNKLQQAIFAALKAQSPRMSGNMQLSIIPLSSGGNTATIVIKAPKYDLKKWKDEGVIVKTGNGSYAQTVNEHGGFGTHNKSMHWVNRVINQCCEMISKDVGGVVEVKLPN